MHEYIIYFFLCINYTTFYLPSSLQCSKSWLSFGCNKKQPLSYLNNKNSHHWNQDFILRGCIASKKRISNNIQFYRHISRCVYDFIDISFYRPRLQPVSKRLLMLLHQKLYFVTIGFQGLPKNSDTSFAIVCIMYVLCSSCTLYISVVLSSEFCLFSVVPVTDTSSSSWEGTMRFTALTSNFSQACPFSFISYPCHCFHSNPSMKYESSNVVTTLTQFNQFLVHDVFGWVHW